jgi:septum site-determining protein MinD
MMIIMRASRSGRRWILQSSDTACIGRAFKVNQRYFSSSGGKVVTVSSGKGGVGKTTTAASLAFGLATAGKRTVVIDFDIGLRNLDIHLGCERRVIFDFVNVLQKECTLAQAMIKDKRNANLQVLAASQTKDKTILTEAGVGELLNELRKQFDYIVCDSPAGIESGARHAMYFAGKFSNPCNSYRSVTSLLL